jgi:Arc/MetJ family transcription regulator
VKPHVVHLIEIISALDNNKMCMYHKFYTHCIGGKTMRTNIVIDDELISEAMTLSQIKTKKAVVETGLKLLVQIKKQERIKNLRGKLKWDGDLDSMRSDQ